MSERFFGTSHKCAKVPVEALTYMENICQLNTHV